MFQLLFLLLKNIDDLTLNDVLSKSELYAKCHKLDITNLPKINVHNFVNICNFVDYYQLINEAEFIANIQYHILCKHKEAIDNMHLIPLNIQQKVYQNPCLTKLKCNKDNIEHVACYKFLGSHQCIPYSINDASRDGHLEIVKYLFEVEHKDCTINAINFASENGHLEVIKYLFEIQHKNCTEYAIVFAIRNNHLEVVKYLFEVLHKDCTEDNLIYAEYVGHSEIIKYLIFLLNKKIE